MLKKEPDPYLGLLAYRSSPVLGLYSPAELLMGRRLRTTVTVHPDHLYPELPDHKSFKEKNNLYKARMKSDHDANAKINPLKKLCVGDDVILRDNSMTGVVSKPSDSMTRRVVVDTEEGGTYIRNRSDVISLAANPLANSDSTSSAFAKESGPRRSTRDVGEPNRLQVFNVARPSRK